MYPFKYKSSIVRNRWYMAAFSTEITREPMERTMLNKPVVMYRKEDGTPVAMYGLCPHRYLPLVQGRVDGDAIVCGYHGFKFADNGDCIQIPSQPKVTGRICQPVYKIVEKGPICWIWMGDEDKCDIDLIPPYEDFGLDQPDWDFHSPNYFHLEGRSQLLVDNLMDLTHLPYVHHHISGKDAMADIPINTEERERSYRITRNGKAPWNDYFKMVFGPEAEFEGLCDFMIKSDFFGPEFMSTSLPIVTAVPGKSEVPKELGTLMILHGATPETDTTTHYFGFSTRNFRLGDKALDQFQLAADQKIRGQDQIAINAVEKRLDYAVTQQRELLVGADKPAVQVRRRIEAMLAAENIPLEEA
ncbi:MAG: aromatic ring-hydroxylating dioxygenase subunit alpha [Paraglaciecola sp.]|uniref:aromatic ring-hydroxylating dioxygenase subunit alpha n=1 Tax=Paraglaciecola sp. TaxID=1920173 RepID=UPI003297B78E